MGVLTRTLAETILVQRVGPLMEVAEMAVTIAGTNADLDDPLAWACRGVGGTTSAHNTVTAAELALLSPAKYDDLLALAEYRTLQNILGALNAVDITVGPRSEKLSQHVVQVQGMLDRLESTVSAIATPMTTGCITLDFAEHGDA